MPKAQVDNLAEYFRLKRPERVTIYSEEQIDDAIEVLLKINPKITKVILTNLRNDRAYVPISANQYLGLYQNGSRREILSIADCVMRNVSLLTSDMAELADLLKTNKDQLKQEAAMLYSLNKHRRTRKRYAQKVAHHPMAKVLFALRDNKIDSVEEFHKAITPLEFIKTIGMVDGGRLQEAINNYKEKSCQETK